MSKKVKDPTTEFFETLIGIPMAIAAVITVVVVFVPIFGLGILAGYWIWG